ncbi:MAG TPA: hypothetical protein VN676_09375 [Steroidobacteraceae bacterium]|jgi:uncharacterized lipoprotein|nr:hypothetical protein [Steroidobacteraceae bacterium]
MRWGSIAKVASFAVLLALSGCHPFRWMAKIGGTCHDKKPYMTARTVAPLVIPPGLDPPDTGSALKIPQLNTPAPPARKEGDPCLDEPPSFVTAKPTPQA